jgi:hypothetical protein
MLHNVGWLLVTDVSGQHIRPIVKDQEVGREILELKTGLIGFPRNIGI